MSTSFYTTSTIRIACTRICYLKKRGTKCHGCKDHLRNDILYNLFVELKEAFGMFETRRGKMSAKDLGPLLRCLGLNPSERDLEEARHELDVCGE